MNRTFLFSALTSFFLIIVFMLPSNAQATVNAYNYVNETDTTYTTRSGTLYSDKTGYDGHAYMSMSTTSGGPSNSMKWKCNTSTTTNYNYHIWIAIPLNYGVYDGTYIYYSKNTDPSEDFSISLNQENFTNQWVYLGYTYGKGGSAKCFVTVANVDSSSSNPREFWIDHMKYYPSSSITAPQGTHQGTGW